MQEPHTCIDLKGAEGSGSSSDLMPPSTHRYTSEDGRHGNGSFMHCLAVIQRIMPQHNCSIPEQQGPGARAGGMVADSRGGLLASGGGDEAASEGYMDDVKVAQDPVDTSDCVLQGSYAPAMVGRFVAVENFAWTARALGLPENATLRQLRDGGQRYCAKHWSSLHAEFSGHIPDQVAMGRCGGRDAHISGVSDRGVSDRLAGAGSQ